LITSSSDRHAGLFPLTSRTLIIDDEVEAAAKAHLET